MTSQGAIYIITQDSRYTGLLLNSARGLKRIAPDFRITVFSQFPIESSAFENVVHVEGSQDGFYDKTVFMQQTPYEKTLFIDADTYIVEPVTELFSLLDHFDCAATHEEYLSTDWWNRYPRPDIPASFPEFNTGILAFKRSIRMDQALRRWSELYRTFAEKEPDSKINDQPFFRAAIYDSDVRVATLTREYNCKFRGQGYLNGTVKILHGHVNLELQEKFVEKAMSVLNASRKPRVYIAGKVYEQRLTSRLVDHRKPGFIWSFPLLPESAVVAKAKALRKLVKQSGAVGLFRRMLQKRRTSGSK